MKRSHLILLLIVLGSLGLRLALTPLIHYPGLHDQNHYYNLGQRLFRGDGFTIDYIWHYNDIPETIVNPADHWMPFSGVAVWAGMVIAGESVQAALIFFILAGTILPLLSYWGSKQLGLDESSAFIAAAFTAVLPDLLSYSLRADTSIFNALFTSLFVLCLMMGLRHSVYWLLASGFFAGLAYLNRNDAVLLLPLLYSTLAVYRLWNKSAIQKRHFWLAIWLIPLVFVVTISPWLIRNQLVLGHWGSPEGNRMFFMVDAREHYAYDTAISLETMLAQSSIPELIYKRAFEFAAAIKQILASLSFIFPFFLLAFLWLLRDKERFLKATPACLWLLGVLIAYPIFIPIKSQSGSFEKAYLGIVPLLLPIAVYGLEKLLPKLRWRLACAAVIIVLMLWQGISLVREENAFADLYYGGIEDLLEIVEGLPDVTGDNEIRLMSQDPYIFSYYGYASLMTPLASREQILDLAERFSIDYILLPANRPSLDALYGQQETDPRFPFAASMAGPYRDFELYILEINEP